MPLRELEPGGVGGAEEDSQGPAQTHPHAAAPDHALGYQGQMNSPFGSLDIGPDASALTHRPLCAGHDLSIACYWMADVLCFVLGSIGSG